MTQAGGDLRDWTRSVMPVAPLTVTQTIAVGGSFDIDVTEYQGVAIFLDIAASVNTTFTVSMLDVGGSAIDSFVWASDSTQYTMANFLRANLVGVATLRFQNTAGATVHMRASLSPHAYPNRFSTNWNTEGGVHLTPVAFAAAGTVVFNPATYIGGPCYARFALTGGATTRGSLQVQTVQSGIMVLTDAGDMVTSGTTGTISRIVALPLGAYRLLAAISTFVAAGTANLDLIPYASYQA